MDTMPDTIFRQYGQLTYDLRDSRFTINVIVNGKNPDLRRLVIRVFHRRQDKIHGIRKTIKQWAQVREVLSTSYEGWEKTVLTIKVPLEPIRTREEWIRLLTAELFTAIHQHLYANLLFEDMNAEWREAEKKNPIVKKHRRK